MKLSQLWDAIISWLSTSRWNAKKSALRSRLSCNYSTNDTCPHKPEYSSYEFRYNIRHFVTQSDWQQSLLLPGYPHRPLALHNSKQSWHNAFVQFSLAKKQKLKGNWPLVLKRPPTDARKVNSTTLTNMTILKCFSNHRGWTPGYRKHWHIRERWLEEWLKWR